MSGGQRPAARLGPWVLEARLGEGAFGAVFAAHHAERTGIRRAIKVLATRDAASLARFEREAELLARVRHPGIVQVHEVGRAGGDAWLVMDLVEGRSLRSVLEESRGAGLPLPAALALARKIAAAAGAAHAARVLHRDLKPENVLLDTAGEPRVVDFGLATAADVERLTKTGSLLGTLGYMAPEQVRARAGEQGPPVDVYAIGAILFELATGSFLLDGPPLAVLDATTRGALPRASERREGLPRELDALLARALALAPEHRFQDGAALAAALAELEAAVAAGRVGGRRRGLLSLGAAGGVLLLVVAAAAALALRPEPGSGGTPAASPATGAGSTPSPRPTPAWFLALARERRPATLPPGVACSDREGEYVNEADGSLLVFVPGGTYRLGTGEGNPDADADERPEHAVELSPYFLGKLEATNAQFERFVRATGYVSEIERPVPDPMLGPHRRTHGGTEEASYRDLPGASWRDPRAKEKKPAPELPVVQVSWADAMAYAAWARLRLPTDAEWEAAARGPRQGGPVPYPWGADPPTAERASAIVGGATKGSLKPAGERPAGAAPCGALDMAGNAREWVLDVGRYAAGREAMADFYRELAARPSPALDPCDTFAVPGNYATHITRGGAFCDTPHELRVTYRGRNIGSDDTTGFRVARSLDGSPRPR